MIEITSLCGQISLGKQGENLARVVCFDEPAMWKETFGEGKCELVHQRSGDEAPYPVVLNVENDKVSWKITNADTAIVGDGKCELHYIVDDVVVKSKIWTTTVLPSLGGAIEEAPEPQKAWVDQVLNAAKEVEENTQRVENATIHQPFIGENKNWFVWNTETQEYIDTGILAEGKKGEAGVIKFIPVDALPDKDIDVNAIYMIPAKNTEEKNTFEEFIYVNGKWESLGTVPVDVDLTDYVKNTQFADKNGNAGVLRLKSTYGISSGRYDGNSPLSGDSAIIASAKEDEIKAKEQLYKPIVPFYLDYAVKMALTDCKIEWTEAEKKAVRILLGVATNEDLGIVVKEMELGEGFEFKHTFQIGEKYKLTWYSPEYGGYLAKDVELTVTNDVDTPYAHGLTGIEFRIPDYATPDPELNSEIILLFYNNPESYNNALCKEYGQNCFSFWETSRHSGSIITLIKVNE